MFSQSEINSPGPRNDALIASIHSAALVCSVHVGLNSSDSVQQTEAADKWEKIQTEWLVIGLFFFSKVCKTGVELAALSVGLQSLHLGT